jgi:predicted nucleic acid-binding Zn finger protein
MISDKSTCSVAFLDPQPQPGEDRVWFVIPSSGTGLYAVSRTACSCPWGIHHKEDITEHPCKHLVALLRALEPATDD